MIAPGEIAVFGSVGILNVGGGDTKLVFDRTNPAEVIRASRIVKDMLRRGYALLVEVERNGEKRFERALDFDEAHAEYIIADFDPVTAEKHDQTEAAAVREKAETHGNEPEPATKAGGGETAKEAPPRRRAYRRRVEATGTRAVAVARSAGG
jgi:hypothetical protein